MLYCGVLCSMSDVIEEIEPLNDQDPNVVPASITAVADVDANLPFTVLGEGDNKVGCLLLWHVGASYVHVAAGRQGGAQLSNQQ